LAIFLLDGSTRVARWYVFIPNNTIWVIFVGSCNGRCWYILWPFGLFYGHLVYFVVTWYILWSFGIYFSVLVCCTEKNLATLGNTAPAAFLINPKIGHFVERGKVFFVLFSVCTLGRVQGCQMFLDKIDQNGDN
jgi:hypothetical protein